jgi:hypothetical protein
VRRIGMLMALASDDPEAQARNAAFLQTLSELGWTVGRNMQIDYRWSGADARPSSSTFRSGCATGCSCPMLLHSRYSRPAGIDIPVCVRKPPEGA